MIMTASQMAQAAPCIRVRYTGRYDYASLVLNVGTAATPYIQLGVSNTSLADAVTNDEMVITSDGTLTLRDVIASICNWNTTTASHDVLEREFDAELWNGLYTDVFGGAVNQYAAAAGSLNLKTGWQSALLIDDNVSGHTSLMVPTPSISKDICAISNIEGYPGSSGTPTVTRTIYDKDGNALWTTGAIATATSALLNPNRPTFTEPCLFGNGPGIVRDTCSDVAHNTATTTVVTWGIPRRR
jgi:hypothetical protein